MTTPRDLPEHVMDVVEAVFLPLELFAFERIGGAWDRLERFLGADDHYPLADAERRLLDRFFERIFLMVFLAGIVLRGERVGRH